MHKLFIFDLDGTLLDTSEGIIYCHNYIADNFGRSRLSSEQFRKVIGGPLLQNIMEYYGMHDAEAQEAISMYREQYVQQGIHMAAHYEGTKELLCHIKEFGAKTAVATLKRQDLAVNILEEFGLSDALDVIFGMDENDTLTKSGLIQKCMEYFGLQPNKTVLIGDSMNDAYGAKKAGVSFIAVTYGLGVIDMNEINADEMFAAVDSVEELRRTCDELLVKK